jgi:hypothetical protein
LRDNGFPGAAFGVGEAGPDEVEEFVDKDPGAFGGMAAERGIKDEEAFAGIAGGMDGLSRPGSGFEAASASAEAAAPFDLQGLALEGADGGESPDQGRAGPCKKLSSLTCT